MRDDGIERLREILGPRKDVIVQGWLERTLRTYPEQTSRFLGQERDRFRNPVGHTFKVALPALFEGLLADGDPSEFAPLLDGIVRIRAVQDFGAGQAVGFLFLLKRVVREALAAEADGDPPGEGLTALEDRIDEMALLAFDLFMRCRERLYEVRTNEARRQLSFLQRRCGATAPAAAPGLPGVTAAGWSGQG